MDSLFQSLDPRSLILSQFSISNQPQTLQLITTTDCFFMERGPRYDDYAALRDSKLRMKQQQQFLQDELKVTVTPPLKKQVRFQGNLAAAAAAVAVPPKRNNRGSSILTQSVPDFSSALRKENRKPPPPTLPPTPTAAAEKSLTPPLKSKSGGRFEAIMGRLGGGGGSKSLNNSGEKKGGGFMNRKSYASLDELRSFTSDARIAINGENRTGRITTRSNVGKTVLGYRQY